MCSHCHGGSKIHICTHMYLRPTCINTQAGQLPGSMNPAPLWQWWSHLSGRVRLCCGNKEARHFRPNNNHSGHPLESTRWPSNPAVLVLTQHRCPCILASGLSLFLFAFTSHLFQLNKFAWPSVNHTKKWCWRGQTRRVWDWERVTEGY